MWCHIPEDIKLYGVTPKDIRLCDDTYQKSLDCGVTRRQYTTCRHISEVTRLYGVIHQEAIYTWCNIPDNFKLYDITYRKSLDYMVSHTPQAIKLHGVTHTPQAIELYGVTI